MPIQYPTTLEELNTITSENQFVVIDFTASWCGPCKRIAPLFEQLSNSVSNVTFCKVDVDDASEISDEYGVSSMPTFVFLDTGKEVHRFSGANNVMLQEKVSAWAT